MKSILGLGNALTDALYPGTSDAVIQELNLPKGSMQLIDADTYHAISRRMHGAERERTTGGSACNTILALSHLGAPVALFGKVGADDDGRFFASEFARRGVELHLIESPLPSGVASTFISPDGQRTFGTYLGAAATLDADDVRPEFFEGHGYLYIEGYLVQNHSLIERAVYEAKRAGLKVVLDLASYNVVEADREFFGELLEHTDIVFANEDEARAFTGLDAYEALDALAEICPIAVVKIGKAGSLVKSGDYIGRATCDATLVTVDTTAAGDYFSAGFLYAHTSGRDLETCLRAGAILGDEIIQVIGTHLPESTWEQIRAKIAAL